MKSGDTDLAQKLRKNIQDTAKDNDIELTPELNIDEKALDKQIDNLQSEAREKSVQKYKDIQDQLHNGQTEWTDSEDFNAADTITKLEQAQSENAEGFNNFVSNMKKYNLSDLESMIFGNGAYESEDQGLRDMEDQIQGFAESIGLTADQTNMLVPILEAMGTLDISPKVDNSELEKTVTDAQTAEQTLEETTGKQYNFDFNTTDLDTIQKQVNQVKKDIEDTYLKRDKNGNVIRDENGIPTYDYSASGAKETAQIYDASIKQQQQAEYQTSALGQSTSSDEVVKAAQDYMTAKNAMDVETQKYNLGMENDLQAATENANNAMEAYAKVADKNGNPLETDLKNLDPQKLEDQLLGVTDKDLKVKVGADTSDAENDIQSLENLSGSTLEVQCDVSNEDSLEQAKSAIESMPPNTTATVDVEVDGKDDVQNVIDLMQSAPTDGSEFVLNCDVQNADDLKAIQAAANELNKTQGTNIQVQATVTGDKDADKLKTSVDSLKGKTVNVTAKVKGTPQVKALHTAIESVNSKTVNVSANVTGTSAVGSLARTIDSLHDKTVTVSVKQVGSVNVGKGNQASGTMLSPAHASGTAYNVLNMKQLSPAHAGGNVALKHNEQALVNEVGTESIVRNGVWSLLPGGAHLENLKQGDIVFSASQTKDLLEHGRTAGHARAYAEGTASLAHAYARSSAANGGGAFGGVTTRTTPPSTSSNNNCENIQGMMDSDTFLSDDGSFTTNGLTNIALENQSMQANQRKIADWKQELAELQKAYNNHYITEEDFISQSESIVSNINQAAKDINSSQQNLISTYIDQITKENEYLQDNISKRKEALDAKKDYYDFDKTIKSKTKDINAIKAQIAALEGTTNAVAKAKLEQLKADLADKQDDLNDTKYDHKIDMESKGYDNLADQADKALDSATQAIKTNTDMQKSVISNMLKEVQKNYKDVYSNITDIVKDSGTQISTEFNKLLTNIKNGKGNFTVTITSKAKANIGGTNAFDNKAPGSTGRENGKTNTKIKNTVKDMGTSNGASDENGVGKQLLQKVTASPSSITMGVGRGASVKIGFVPSNATYKTFTYEESNKGIASIVKGKTSLSLKGLKVGSTTITVKGHGAGCKSAKITVKVTKDGAQKTATAKNVAKSMGYSLHTNDVTKILNATKGESNSSTKDFVKSYILQKKRDAAEQKITEQEIKESDLKTKLFKWFTALPAFKGDASKIADPVIKHIAQKGKKANDIARRRSKVSTPDQYEAYPTRSANVDQNIGTWQWGVDGGEDTPGKINGYYYPQTAGVLIMFSISCEG